MKKNDSIKKKRWQVERPDAQLVQALQNDLQISAIAAKILAARGCETSAAAESLLNMTEVNIHDPFLMHGMAEAVHVSNKHLKTAKRY